MLRMQASSAAVGSVRAPGGGMNGRTIGWIYFSSVAVLAALFLLGFAQVYEARLQGGEAVSGSLRAGYCTMLAGGLVLLVQALAVHFGILRRLGEFERRNRTLSLDLERRASLDELTKAYTRSMFDVLLAREIDNVRRRGTPVSAVMFDVDGFRELNDAYGYAGGDRVLAELARTVRRGTRRTDYLFRWRGGTFVILAPHIDLEQAGVFADKLRRLVERTLFADVGVTVSMAVAEVAGDETPESFALRLKHALGTAKANGPSGLSLAGPPPVTQ